MPAIVLIAPTAFLNDLTRGGELRDAMAFADTEALRALGEITRRPPDVVALEETFANTSRGAALVNRLKADPALARCEVRIISRASVVAAAASAAATAPAVVEPPILDVPPAPAPVPTSALTPAAAAPAPEAQPPAVTPPPAAPTAPSAPLDVVGTRRSERFPIEEGVEILIDGNPAKLVDLSVGGAQVVSPTTLKPNQRVRVVLSDPGRVLRIGGTIAWCAFEMPKSGPQYRAGIAFADADPDEIARFVNSHRR